MFTLPQGEALDPKLIAMDSGGQKNHYKNYYHLEKYHPRQNTRKNNRKKTTILTPP